MSERGGITGVSDFRWQPLRDAGEVGHFFPQACPRERALCAYPHGARGGDDQRELDRRRHPRKPQPPLRFFLAACGLGVWVLCGVRTGGVVGVGKD